MKFSAFIMNKINPPKTFLSHNSSLTKIEKKRGISIVLKVMLPFTPAIGYMQWVETNPSNICIFPTDMHFISPHGTTLKAFVDVKYRCLQMLEGLVYTHPSL
jgi:hypothetical protein